jgi:hypothetical protein
MLIYDKICNDKDDVMAMMAGSLSGTCMNYPSNLFDDSEYLRGIKHFHITEKDFCTYLTEEGIYECETCGWWTYAGNGDGTNCDDCVYEPEKEYDD